MHLMLDWIWYFVTEISDVIAICQPYKFCWQSSFYTDMAVICVDDIVHSGNVHRLRMRAFVTGQKPSHRGVQTIIKSSFWELWNISPCTLIVGSVLFLCKWVCWCMSLQCKLSRSVNSTQSLWPITSITLHWQMDSHNNTDSLRNHFPALFDRSFAKYWNFGLWRVQSNITHWIGFWHVTSQI